MPEFQSRRQEQRDRFGILRRRNEHEAPEVDRRPFQRLRRDQQIGVLLDLPAQLIDGRIALDHLLGQRGILILERLHRAADCLLDHATEYQHFVLETF